MTFMSRVDIQGAGHFKASKGETLLDAALLHGIDLPHDCRAGVCGTCRVRVFSGAADGGGTGDSCSILACQARLSGDLTIGVEAVPPVESSPATVAEVSDLGCGVVQVGITPKRWIPHLAGQYFRFQFKGFPARSYSPTIPLEGPAESGAFRLHVRRVRGGLVSNAFGGEIRPGHKVRILGPYGSAFFRPLDKGRLVLIGTGTGFAPIWAIAHQALCQEPDREMVVIAGARSTDGLYMVPALERLARFPRVTVRPFVMSSSDSRAVRLVGHALDHIPALRPDDSVYVAGSPDMVADVMAVCQDAGVACHADSFGPASQASTERRRSGSKHDQGQHWPDRRSPDDVVGHILSRSGGAPVCVLAADVQTMPDDLAVVSLARAFAKRASTVVLGAGMAPPSPEVSGAAGTPPWHYLPAPAAANAGAETAPLDFSAWALRAAGELTRLRGEHEVVVLAVPPMDTSALAWGLSAVSQFAVLRLAGGPADFFAANALHAHGVGEVVTLAAS